MTSQRKTQGKGGLVCRPRAARAQGAGGPGVDCACVAGARGGREIRVGQGKPPPLAAKFASAIYVSVRREEG